MSYTVITLDDKSLARQNCIFVGNAKTDIAKVVGKNVYLRVKSYPNILSTNNINHVLIFKNH
jgi:hypothetical protein